jgi:predicted metal-dependent hydrolase
MIPIRKTSLHSVEVGDQRVDYTVRISRAARRARIRVAPAGVEVVLPTDSGLDRAESFLQENGDWLLDQLAFFNRTGNFRIEAGVNDDAHILFNGVKTATEVVEVDSRARCARVIHEADCLKVIIPRGGAVNPHASLQNWLRRKARKIVHERLELRAPEMGVKFDRVFIRAQRTRWGSCSSRKNLSFNWRLVMAPPEVLDYLVVHELAHLLEPNHSMKFWLIVRSYCPRFEQHRAWLKQNQEVLQNYLQPVV